MATAANTTKPVVLTFNREKETKNTIKFDEQESPGQPKIVGSLYMQKWAAGDMASLKVTIERAL